MFYRQVKYFSLDILFIYVENLLHYLLLSKFLLFSSLLIFISLKKISRPTFMWFQHCLSITKITLKLLIFFLNGNLLLKK